MNPQQILGRLQSAVVLHQQGDLDQAEAMYREVLAFDENNFYSLRFLGSLLSAKGECEDGIALLRQAISIRDADLDCWFSLGNAYKADLQFKQAILAYQAAEERGSRNPQVFNNWGRCLQQLSMQKESIPVLEKAIKIDHQCFGAWFALGNSWRDLGQASQAVFCYKKSIAVSPLFSDAYVNLGILLKEQGEVVEAVACYRRAIEVRPDCADAFLGLGNLLNDEGPVDEALICYRRAIELKPDFAEAYLNLGNLLKDQGKAGDAIASYRKAIDVKPDFAEAYLNLGNLLKDQGKAGDAIANYRKAIEIRPNFVDALSRLASELSKRDEFDEAISLYKRALAEDPEHVNSSAGLGWCFLKSDRSEEAIEYYSNLLISTPSDTDSLFFLFEALRGELQIKLLKDFSYATNFLKKCLGIMGVSKVVAFGDSHVQLFEGCNEIDVNHVGASTAYNLVKENSSTGGRRQVLSRVSRMNPMAEAVLLCFGEVDIRSNVIKYCYQKGLSIDECVDVVVDRYMSFAGEIASRGFKVLVYGGYGAGGDRMSAGSERERNYAAKCLNAALSIKCEENDFVYFSLHDVLLDEEHLQTDSSFLSDGFHLHNDALIAREQVQTLLFERAYVAAKALFEKRKIQSSRHVVLGNVGVSKPLRIGLLESGCLSWDAESDPLQSVVFDLGSFIRFESIILELESDLDADQMSLMIDGRLVNVDVSREFSCRWHLRPVDQSVPFIGRYPMLKASSDFLLSIKDFSVKELSLV